MPKPIKGSQAQGCAVLRHLRTGKHITALEAQSLYRVFRLAARIFELRAKLVKEGDTHEIATTVVRDSTGKPYARYSLQKKPCRALVPYKPQPLPLIRPFGLPPGFSI